MPNRATIGELAPLACLKLTAKIVIWWELRFKAWVISAETSALKFFISSYTDAWRSLSYIGKISNYRKI